MKNILILLFFSLCLYQAQAQNYVGGAGICYTDSDPDMVEELDSITSMRVCRIALDVKHNKLYQYDSSEVVGQRWKELGIKLDSFLIRTDSTTDTMTTQLLFTSPQAMLQYTLSGDSGKVTLTTTLNFSLLDTTQTKDIANQLIAVASARKLLADSLLQEQVTTPPSSISFEVYTASEQTGNYTDVPFDLPSDSLAHQRLVAIREGYYALPSHDYIITTDINSNRRRIAWMIPLLSETIMVKIINP